MFFYEVEIALCTINLNWNKLSKPYFFIFGNILIKIFLFMWDGDNQEHVRNLIFLNSKSCLQLQDFLSGM